MTAGELTKKALGTVFNTGQAALQDACINILTSKYDDGAVRDVLHYYAKLVLPKVLPIFPALISLSSKAAGGKEKTAQPVAAAMLLITASGDIHDDIVDNSETKFGNKTLFGKYGRDLSLLAGDLLLTQGITELQKTCAILSQQQQTAIFALIYEGMINIVKAEATEPLLWKKKTITPQELFEVINLKGGVAELHCRIGGIIAGADHATIENLARYGRLVGVLSTLKEEFVDLSNPLELEHRLKFELPPYPMLCAMQNSAVNAEISALKKKSGIPKIVLGSSEVAKLVEDCKVQGKKELADNPLLHGECASVELAVLLEALAFELPLV
jgi:geranylgeranyl pyrophosphate synthase